MLILKGKARPILWSNSPLQTSGMKTLAFQTETVSKRFLVVLALFLAVFCLPLSRAQDSTDVHVVPRAPKDKNNTQQPDLSDFRTSLLKVQVDLVLVPVTVTDSMNRPIIGLGKDDFTVFEDERPQDIRYFSTEDAPISVGILLDVSGTMSNKIDAAREALGEFFQASHPDDDYFVITFADRPTLLADSTKSIGDIQGKLATVKPFGYTALLDAIEMGIEKLRSARYPRRALLIISDGGDNASRHKLRHVKSEVEESGVEVYAIGLFDDGLPVFKSLDEKLGNRILSRVTEASGGHAVTVENLAKLPSIASSISTEMRSQYLLGYRPAKQVRDGRWRKIKVQVTSASPHQSDTVRLHPAYKKGYLASRP